MEKVISISQFYRAIERLPVDTPLKRPGVWYLCQHEHWLGWLAGYHGSGAYGRKTGVVRDARFAYNHVVCPDLLLYLIRAIPLRQELIDAAEDACRNGTSVMQKSGAIRKIVPWSEIYQAIWADKEPSFWERIQNKLNI